LPAAHSNATSTSRPPPSAPSGSPATYTYRCATARCCTPTTTNRGCARRRPSWSAPRTASTASWGCCPGGSSPSGATTWCCRAAAARSTRTAYSSRWCTSARTGWTPSRGSRTSRGSTGTCSPTGPVTSASPSGRSRPRPARNSRAWCPRSPPPASGTRPMRAAPTPWTRSSTGPLSPRTRASRCRSPSTARPARRSGYAARWSTYHCPKWTPRRSVPRCRSSRSG
jgi:hypothetical protein